MEMPEGWKRLYQDIQLKINACYDQAQDTRNGACTPVGCLCYTTELESLDLMKEMAEALKEYKKYYGWREDCSANQVLVKWENWK